MNSLLAAPAPRATNAAAPPAARNRLREVISTLLLLAPCQSSIQRHEGQVAGAARQPPRDAGKRRGHEAAPAIRRTVNRGQFVASIALMFSGAATKGRLNPGQPISGSFESAAGPLQARPGAQTLRRLSN